MYHEPCAALGHLSLLAILITVVPAHSLLWQLSTEDGGGAHPPFRERETGPQEDALAILQRCGANAFRMQVWNVPGPLDAYANVTRALQMARRCACHNLLFILDLHYSDGWAGPSTQTKPVAWARMPLSELHDGAYKGQVHVIVPFMGRNNGTLTVRWQWYNDAHRA